MLKINQNSAFVPLTKYKNALKASVKLDVKYLLLPVKRKLRITQQIGFYLEASFKSVFVQQNI